MRPPTRSEKFLLGVLGVVLLGGALFLGGSNLTDRQRLLDHQRRQLQADQLEAMADLQEQSLWAGRKAWLHDHQPLLDERGDVQAQVLDFVVKGARAHHLEIDEQDLGTVQQGAGGASVGAELKLKGSMEALCRWLAELQQPQNFYAVNFFSLKAAPDEKSVICELHVARYFREDGR